MSSQQTGIYLRISDDREGRELGVERQEEDCRTALDRLDALLVDVYKDNDISASTISRKRRPEYERLLADARSGRVNHIIAYTSARLTRRPREFEDLIELAQRYGVTFHYLRSPSFDLNTAQGRQVARTLAAGDASYPEIISELVLRKKEASRVAGKPNGGRRPFGFEGDHVAIRKVEADLIERATHDVLAGASLGSVARAWNEVGMPTTTWHPPLMLTRWTNDKVRAVLLRARNAGLVSHGDRIVGEAEWDAIVDRETWEALRGVINDPSRLTHKGTSRVLIGSFLYRCECGELVHSGGLTRKGGQPRYRCKGCNLQRLAKPVDKVVIDIVELDLATNGAGLLPARDNVKPLRDRLGTLEAQEREIAAAFGDPNVRMTSAQFGLANARIQAEIETVKAELGRAQAGSALAGIADAADPVAAFRAADMDRKRAIIRDRLQVTLMRVGRGRKPFGPESVKIDPA